MVITCFQLFWELKMSKMNEAMYLQCALVLCKCEVCPYYKYWLVKTPSFVKISHHLARGGSSGVNFDVRPW